MVNSLIQAMYVENFPRTIENNGFINGISWIRSDEWGWISCSVNTLQKQQCTRRVWGPWVRQLDLCRTLKLRNSMRQSWKGKKGKLKTLWRALNCQHIFQHVGSGDTLASFALVKCIGFIMISVIHMYRDKVLDLCNSCGNKNED